MEDRNLLEREALSPLRSIKTAQFPNNFCFGLREIGEERGIRKGSSALSRVLSPGLPRQHFGGNREKRKI